MIVPSPKAMRSCPESCFEEEGTARFGFWEMAALHVADGGGVGLESRQPVLSLK